MKSLSIFLLLCLLSVSLTFAGKAFFGMDHGMFMESVECVNHCIDSTVVAGVMNSGLPVILFVIMFFIGKFVYTVQSDTVFYRRMIKWRRLTEPIRLFFQKKILATVIIQD